MRGKLQPHEVVQVFGRACRSYKRLMISSGPTYWLPKLPRITMICNHLSAAIVHGGLQDDQARHGQDIFISAVFAAYSRYNFDHLD